MAKARLIRSADGWNRPDATVVPAAYIALATMTSASMVMQSSSLSSSAC